MSQPALKKPSLIARIVAAIASVTATASILASIGALAEPPAEGRVLAQAAAGHVLR